MTCRCLFSPGAGTGAIATHSSRKSFHLLPLYSSSSSPHPDPELLPNALRRKTHPQFPRLTGFSLGVDLGAARTGLALGKGFAPPRPFSVLKLRGQKLEMRLLEIAVDEEVDEFIVGLPKSIDGKETPQSNKVRSIVGRLAVRAADRGLRVYLQDEHGTTLDASNFMIAAEVKRSDWNTKLDAYAAAMLLDRYFLSCGVEAELVLPKQPAQQRILEEKLWMVDEYF